MNKIQQRREECILLEREWINGRLAYYQNKEELSSRVLTLLSCDRFNMPTCYLVEPPEYRGLNDINYQLFIPIMYLPDDHEVVSEILTVIGRTLEQTAKEGVSNTDQDNLVSNSFSLSGYFAFENLFEAVKDAAFRVISDVPLTAAGNSLMERMVLFEAFQGIRGYADTHKDVALEAVELADEK